MRLYERALEGGEGSRFLKRAIWHDYRSPCIYMATILKMPGVPPLATIEGHLVNGKAAAVSRPTRLGYEIGYALRGLKYRFTEIKTLQYVFMPDHVHLLLHVTEAITYHFSDVIRAFKQDCSARYKAMLRRECDHVFDGHVFADGYNDRILSGRDQLSTLIAYIRDNPRRLYLRRAFPEHFRSHLRLEVGDKTLAVFGNPLLLESPFKVQVRYSSKYAPDRLEAYKRSWEENIRSGGVLVSPFIHPLEREYMYQALDGGAKLIIIRENGFPERWKPERRFTEACAAGRMLFVGPVEFVSRRTDLTREACLELNDSAALIAALQPGSYRLRR